MHLKRPINLSMHKEIISCINYTIMRHPIISTQQRNSAFFFTFLLTKHVARTETVGKINFRKKTTTNKQTNKRQSHRRQHSLPLSISTKAKRCCCCVRALIIHSHTKIKKKLCTQTAIAIESSINVNLPTTCPGQSQRSTKSNVVITSRIHIAS